MYADGVSLGLLPGQAECDVTEHVGAEWPQVLPADVRAVRVHSRHRVGRDRAVCRQETLQVQGAPQGARCHRRRLRGLQRLPGTPHVFLLFSCFFAEFKTLIEIGSFSLSASEH